MKQLAKFTATVIALSLSVGTASAQVITFDDLAPNSGNFGGFLNPDPPPHTGCLQTPGAIIGAGFYGAYVFGTSLFSQQTTQAGWGCTTAANPYSGNAPGGASGGYAFSYLGAGSLFVDFLGVLNVSSARLAGLSSVFPDNQSSVTVYGYDAVGYQIFTSSTLSLTGNFQTLALNFTGVRALEFRGASSSGDKFFAVDDIAHSPFGQIDEPSTVPEPGTYVLMGAGLLGLAGIARRRRV